MVSRALCTRKRIRSNFFDFHRIGVSQKSDKVVPSTPSLISLLPTQQLPLSSPSYQCMGRLSTRDYTYRSFFTNGQTINKDNPYDILGLQWGDGATSAEIRQAFRQRAKLLHPDVVDTTVMSTEQAHEEFQKLVGAYEALMKHVSADSCDSMEEWKVALWRQSDRIALDRTDVAGTMRKRPVQSAQTRKSVYGGELGHPSGKGVVRRGEFLSNGTTQTTKYGRKLQSSTVGRGQSKWVKTKTKKVYKEWNPFRL